MKLSLAAASVLLLAAFCSEGLADPAGADAMTPCCVSYAPRRIPLTHVQDYFHTSSQCPMPAVVFVTRKGRQICADPDHTWVQHSISYLKRRSSPAPDTSA